MQTLNLKIAISTRVDDKKHVRGEILDAMRVLAELGRSREMDDDLWPKLLELIPDTAP